LLGSLGEGIARDISLQLHSICMASPFAAPSSSWSHLSPYGSSDRPADEISKTGSFRIVSLLPGEYEDPTIECRLQEVSLSDTSVKYVALSYCWGSRNADVRIWCNSRPVKVTANLYAALRNARARASPVSLWIGKSELYRISIDLALIASPRPIMHRPNQYSRPQ
jgi:hypothetical protein